MFGPHSNYLFDRNADKRQRLENQFHLLGEDFDRWFDEALLMGGLSTDPSGAVWSLLDLGCGEGQFTRQVARRYPDATVVGMDVDRAAVEAGSRDGAGNVRFLVHDAREPPPPVLDRGAPFDIAVIWMVLHYLYDKKSALANLAGALAPGGALLLCDQPDEAVRFSHPVTTELIAARLEIVAAARRAVVEVGGLMHLLSCTALTPPTAETFPFSATRWRPSEARMLGPSSMPTSTARRMGGRRKALRAR